MHQRQLNHYQQIKGNFDSLFAFASLGISIYLAVISRRNLEYNARNAIATEHVSEQLKLINHSNFMYELNCKINKGENKNE